MNPAIEVERLTRRFGSFVAVDDVQFQVGQGEIFGTRISLIWFQVFPEQAESLEGLIAQLKAQRLAAIKEELVEAGSAAMDFARWLPRRFYTGMARHTFAGELCSFFFAYTDEFLPG